MAQDDEHLRLLSILHYVVAAITGLFASFPLIHLAIGLLTLFAPDKLGGEAPPAFVGWIFVAIGAALVALGWALAGCMIAVGRSLARRRRYMFCLVVAAIECLSNALWHGARGLHDRRAHAGFGKGGVPRNSAVGLDFSLLYISLEELTAFESHCQG